MDSGVMWSLIGSVCMQNGTARRDCLVIRSHCMRLMFKLTSYWISLSQQDAMLLHTQSRNWSNMYMNQQSYVLPQFAPMASGRCG